MSDRNMPRGLGWLPHWSSSQDADNSQAIIGRSETREVSAWWPTSNQLVVCSVGQSRILLSQ